MGFQIEVLPVEEYPQEAARRLAEALPGGGSFVVTGGGTAEKIFPHLAGKKDDWTGVTIAFSDERVVPPDHEESNYAMAKRLFLDAAEPGRIHRIKGELEAEQAAADYETDLRPLVNEGFDLLMLGMGEDAHVGAMFPESPGLTTQRLALPVDRPDGMKGVTLTARSMLSAKKVFVTVTGAKKAAAVKRVIQGDEEPDAAPARLLAAHPDVTFLLDEQAASEL
jgi:6-phosphogluconolactonase